MARRPQFTPNDPRDTSSAPDVDRAPEVGGGVVAAPGAMASQADALEAAGEVVRSFLTSLQDRVVAHEGAWGVCEVGSAFAQDYVPAQGNVFDTLAAVQGIVDQLARGIRKTADNYDRADQQAREATEAL